MDEDFADDEAIVAGAILLMLSLRARYSDFRQIVQVSISTNVIEVEVSVTKTSRKVSRSLPLIWRGPRLLTMGQDWWPKFDKARVRAGIPFPTYPLFPFRNEEGWGGSQGRPTDFNEAMALVFSDVGFTPDEFPSSHGLQATMLAWACRYGIPKESREALGYHVGCQKPGTVQIYARYRIEAPLAELCAMLMDIRSERFNPDAGDVLSWHIAKKGAASKDDKTG